MQKTGHGPVFLCILAGPLFSERPVLDLLIDGFSTVFVPREDVKFEIIQVALLVP